MKTEIKNTLYRFITMRAPELVEKSIVATDFVSHPEIKGVLNEQYTSVFLNAINPIPSGETKRQVLQETATAFAVNSIKTRNKLREFINEDVYDFAIWLTKNRTTFLYTDLDDYFTKKPNVKLFKPDSGKNVALWDNLFYQIITFKSNYVRDEIISILVASHFIDTYSSINKEEIEKLRILAQARVIMPKFMFEGEENISASENKNSKIANLKKIVNSKGLENVNALLIFENQRNQLNAIKKSLLTIEKKYKIINQKELDDYNIQFDLDTKAAYAAATPIELTYTDPVTNIVTKYTDYENLNLPVYNFQPKGELAYCTTTPYKDTLFFNFTNRCIDELLFGTFKEVYDFINDKIKELTAKQFEKTTTSKRMANVGGIVVSTTNGSNSYARTQSTFSFITLNSGSNKYLALTFIGMEIGTDIVSGNYTIAFDNTGDTINGEYQNVSSSSEWINGKLVLKIFNYASNYFLTDEENGIALTGTFVSSTGRVLTVEGLGHVIDNQRNHDLSESIADADGNYDYTTSSASYVASGKGNYVYEDFVSGSTGSTGSTDTDVSATNGGAPTNIGTQPTNTDIIPPNQNVINYIPSGYGIKRLGIADYRKVEQEVCCYVPGEVSHIENVMAREYKEKATRRLRRQEDTVTTSKEKETEKLTDSTSTDRFEMNQEVNSVVSEQNSFAAGAQISWSGLISGNAHADFAHNTSQETSNHQAVTNAQEVTDRVLDRVVQKVKEERITKIIEEYEETSKHGYDNRKGDKHISGVYRWVDKIYRNQVINYGKRLMYEFMIPEPAAFHTMAIEHKKDAYDIEELVKPIDPRTVSGSLALTNFLAVREETYAHWAAIYKAEVEAMPDAEIIIGTSIGFEKESSDGLIERFCKSETIKINDERYKATLGKAVMIAHDDTGSNLHLASVCFGDKFIGTTGLLRGVLKIAQGSNTNANSSLLSNNFDYQNIGEYKNEVPVSVQFYNYHTGTVNVSVKCQLSEEALKQWQIETFNAIISAYEDQLKEYNDKMAELKSLQVQKVKLNPMFYRQIENTLLRKNCIEYMVSHDVLGKESLLDGGTLGTLRVKYDSPNLEAYSAKVKFFEQAFEWDLMSYYFYPFYWADKTKWQSMYCVEELDDPIFRAFLQSGMARVIITVRPGFEEAVNWYMATGQVWNGGQVPTLDDPLFVSIVKELQQPEGAVEQTWESRVPTSLTVIQAGTIGLNVEGLPCDEDCEDNLRFDSDGNPVLDLNGNPIKIIDQNPDTVVLGNITDELDTVSESIEEIKTDIEEIKTTLEGMSGGN